MLNVFAPLLRFRLYSYVHTNTIAKLVKHVHQLKQTCKLQKSINFKIVFYQSKMHCISV